MFRPNESRKRPLNIAWDGIDLGFRLALLARYASCSCRVSEKTYATVIGYP